MLKTRAGLSSLLALGLAAVVAAPAASAELRTATYSSAALGRDVSYVVDLPDSYASGDRKYPVVYALHDLFEGPGFWQRRGLAPILAALRAKGELPEFLVVAVEGGNSSSCSASSAARCRTSCSTTRRASPTPSHVRAWAGSCASRRCSGR